jgi:hypothetical protein
MASGFDAGTLDVLRATREIGIRVNTRPDRATVVWVVVAGEDVFVRSFLGPKGRWYKAAVADGRATLEAGAGKIPVRVTAAADQASIGRASQAFLAKYGDSPYAQKMVRPEVLTTTLLLLPA